MTQQEFFDRYSYDVAVDRIGGGGFGTVYKAYDNVLHRNVAMKVSEVKTTSDGKKTFSLKDEFEALNHVPKHRNIANYEEFYSFKTPQGIFDYAVMQYYPDGNLSNAIKEGMSNEQKEEVAMQLLEGIDFLHKHKVVHRDLKPGNILIVKHGGHIIPLITDFGLSKAADSGDGSQFSNSFGGGTQRYSSPEQLQGKPLRFNTDLWSYGAIVYELFMNEQLFSPGSGASNSAQAELEVYNKIIHGDVIKLCKMPERWRKVAERCMVVNPEQRVKSAEELMFLLKGYEETTIVEGMTEPNTQPQSNSQPKAEQETLLVSKQKPNLVDLKPSEKNKSKLSKEKTPLGKNGKNLWIGLSFFLATLVTVLLFMLLKPAYDDPDTKSYKACQSVNDYRDYLSNYGKTAHYYNEAKFFVDSVVADSIVREQELLAQKITQEKAETEAIAKAEAEKEEEESFNKCTTIYGCVRYLENYPNGKYVDQVKENKSVMEEDNAYNKCTSINACLAYLDSYPQGKFVNEVTKRKAKFENIAHQPISTHYIANTAATKKEPFSVSSNRRVYFSEGNLQYNASTNEWRIAPNPWDYIGEANSNISPTYKGWIDLFGWGTGDNPTNKSTNDSDYFYFAGWGAKSGIDWRTLTEDEWDYLFNNRVTDSGERFAKAQVNDVNGMILLPDTWNKATYSLNDTNKKDARFSCNNINASTWYSVFAPAGAVFLPNAGYRHWSSTSVFQVSTDGYYWTSTPARDDGARAMNIYNIGFTAHAWEYRSSGRSVRLVRPVK